MSSCSDTFGLLPFQYVGLLLNSAVVFYNNTSFIFFRLYSDYLYFNSKNKSADDFHKAVSYAVDVYHNCTLKHSLRSCIYNLSVANRVRVSHWYLGTFSCNLIFIIYF